MTTMMSSHHNATANPKAPPGEPLSNGQLLRSFIGTRDEAAFAELVNRHGPMVLGVCRRLLGNEHDAADAFQAAFLVLARKAASIRAPEVLGTWLYNVAYRVSMKARSVRLKRASRERQVSVMPEPAVECVAIDDLSEVLDEELRALPANYQAAIILCDLQGRSRKEAAATLKVPEGTVSSRLATARQKLALRLRRRGVAVSATALAATLGQSVAQASVPAALAVTTVKAALPAAAGQATAGLISAKTLVLADSVMKSMLLAKLNLAAFAFLGLCILGGVIQLGLTLTQAQPDEQAEALATLTKLGARLRWEGGLTGKRLVTIDLKRTKVKDEHLKVLAVFKDVRELSLSDTAVTDAGCTELVSLQELRALQMNGTSVSDAGIKHIAKLSKLETLAIGWTKIGDTELKSLAPLAGLRELDLRHTGVTDNGLKDLTPLRKLHTLELGNTAITDAGIPHLAALPDLRKLDLENTAITDQGAKDLTASKSLESLSLAGAKGVTDAALTDLVRLQSLIVLRLGGTQVTDAGVPTLARLKQLRFLALDKSAVTGAGFADAAGFKLTTLWLSGSKATDAGLKNIAALRTLQNLHLDRTPVTDAGVRQLLSLKQLESLALEDTRVTDELATYLPGMTRLWLLNLSGTKITDEGLARLGTMPNVHWLGLHKTAITDAGMKDLARLRDLDTLWVSWTKVSEVGLKELATLKKLKTLRLGGLPITDAGLKDLAPLKNLRTLWLDWTKITDAGLKELAAFKHLEELRLDGTAIAGSGLQDLAALRKLRRVDATKLPSQPTNAAINHIQTALPGVVITTQRRDGPEAEAGTGARAFWWLLAAAALLAAAFLAVWLISKRRRVNWTRVLIVSAACSVLATLILLGQRMFQGTGVAVEAASASSPKEHILRGHFGPVHCVRFTSDARRLISVSGWPGKDHSVRIWDLATDKELHHIQAPGQLASLVLSADGLHALTGGAGALMYINVETGEVDKRIRTSFAGCPSVAIAGDGRHVYSASLDGFARRWDLQGGKEVGRFRVAGKWARFVGELPDGRLVTGDNTGLVQIWDVPSGREVQRINTGPTWLASGLILPGGKQMLTGNWHANLWDLETGQKLQVFKGHKNDVQSMRLSSDGKQLLTASFDGTAKLWDFESGEPLETIMSQEEFLFAADLSKDSRWIACAGGGRKEGKNYVTGIAHDIHVFEMPAPPPETLAETAGLPWVLIASAAASALVLAALTLLAVRGRRHRRQPASAKAGTAGGIAGGVVFACSHCGKRLRARSDLAGKQVKCPKCAAASKVPATSEQILQK